MIYSCVISIAYLQCFIASPFQEYLLCNERFELSLSLCMYTVQIQTPIFDKNFQ